MYGFDRWKLEHDEPAPVVLTFQQFHRRALHKEFAAKLLDKRNDRFPVLLVLLLIVDGALHYELGRHIVSIRYFK